MQRHSIDQPRKKKLFSMNPCKQPGILERTKPFKIQHCIRVPNEFRGQTARAKMLDRDGTCWECGKFPDQHRVRRPAAKGV